MSAIHKPPLRRWRLTMQSKLFFISFITLWCASYCAKSAHEWADMDYDELDKKWESEDEEEELKAKAAPPPKKKSTKKSKSSKSKKAAKRKTSQQWSKMNYDDVDKQWESGDEEDELISEHDVLNRKAARIQKQELDQLTAQQNNPKRKKFDIGKLSPAPTMMFVSLIDKEWSKEDIGELSGKWRALLLTGGIDVQIYGIEGNRVLVSLQRGWQSQELKTFLFEQPEVTQIEWNQNIYTREKEREKAQKEKEEEEAEEERQRQIKRMKKPKKRKVKEEL